MARVQISLFYLRGLAPLRCTPTESLRLNIEVSLAQQFDVLDIRRDFGWQRRLRVGLGEAIEAGLRIPSESSRRHGDLRTGLCWRKLIS